MPDNGEKTAVEVPANQEGTPGPAKSPPGGDGRIDRIVHETRQLSDELMDWVNLRLKLIQLDVQERVDQELDFVFSGVIVLAMIVIALLMASFGIAYILGDLLGRLWYGFAIMAVIYLLAGLVISRVRPRLAAGFRANWSDEGLEKGTEVEKVDQQG